MENKYFLVFCNVWFQQSCRIFSSQAVQPLSLSLSHLLALSLSIETELGTCSFQTVKIQGQWRCHCCRSCKYIVVYIQKTQSLAPFYTTESVNSRGEGLCFSLPFQVKAFYKNVSRPFRHVLKEFFLLL